jgi:hypothetical protein
VLMFAFPYQEVVGLDVPVQKALLVDVLNTLQHLNGYHQHSFQGEFATTVDEQLLERRSKQVHDEHVAAMFGYKFMNAWNANRAVEDSVQFRLVI